MTTQQQPTPTPAPPGAFERRPKRARMVVNETLCHRPASGQPASTVLRYSRPLDTDEQPFVRYFDAPPGWAPLQTGWFDGKPPGMLLLSSTGAAVELGLLADDAEPPGGSRTAWSPPRRAEPLVVRFARVRPGESLRFEPTDLPLLRVRRVGDGPAKCVLTLIPE